MNDLVPADDVRERLTRLVTDSLTSPHSKRAYAKALDEFFTWVQGKGSFSKALVTAYKSWLEEKNLAPATINLRLAAVRKLAEEASDNGLLQGDIAAAILEGPLFRAVSKGSRIGSGAMTAQALYLDDANVALLQTAERISETRRASWPPEMPG